MKNALNKTLALNPRSVANCSLRSWKLKGKFWHQIWKDRKIFYMVENGLKLLTISEAKIGKLNGLKNAQYSWLWVYSIPHFIPFNWLNLDGNILDIFGPSPSQTQFNARIACTKGLKGHLELSTQNHAIVPIPLAIWLRRYSGQCRLQQCQTENGGYQQSCRPFEGEKGPQLCRWQHRCSLWLYAVGTN